MAGYYEIRVEGPGRHHYRLFSLVLITGKDKPFRTVLSTRDYADVRRLGAEYLSRRPRSVLR
jgi:hypothetical protein